jgi:hypothetical protein
MTEDRLPKGVARIDDLTAGVDGIRARRDCRTAGLRCAARSGTIAARAGICSGGSVLCCHAGLGCLDVRRIFRVIVRRIVAGFFKLNQLCANFGPCNGRVRLSEGDDRSGKSGNDNDRVNQRLS